MALKDSLRRIETLKKEWDKLQPLSNEADEKLWKKFRLEWNYNSNHIEGNTLTYSETELLLIFDKTTGEHQAREFEEMKAHDVAIKMIDEWSHDKTRKLTETDIRTLNKIILVRPFFKEAITQSGQKTRRQIKVGGYKEHPNSVLLKNGEMFHYSSPEETPILMKELFEWFKKENTLSPVELAAEFHYRFIRIHPFDDGNGRIARLIVNYVLMRDNYPPVIIKSDDKENYLTALQKADVGNKTAFHQYMADQLIWSLEISIKAAKGESIEEPDDIEKEIAIFKREIKHKKDSIPRSKKQIVFIYEKSLKALLEDYINKMVNHFGDLFNSNVPWGIFNKIRNEKGINYISEQINYLAPKPILNPTAEQKTYNTLLQLTEKTSSIPDDMGVNIDFNHFKKNGKKPFDVSVSISIDFKDLFYRINVMGEHREYLYSEIISESERKEIIGLCLKGTLEQIKTKLSENNGNSPRIAFY